MAAAGDVESATVHFSGDEDTALPSPITTEPSPRDSMKRKSNRFSMTSLRESSWRGANLQLRFRDVRFSSVTQGPIDKVRGVPPTVKTILNGVDGVVNSGEVLAVIGPSGAGKTSLLDILVGKVRAGSATVTLEGSITVDGLPLTRAFFVKHCAYVPQEDRLWSALTVRENFEFATRLYCPTISPSERASIVANVLHDLGLDGCSDVKVGNVFIKGISGGQKRRTSIGIELVADRRCLFLDEPTSGLDSAGAGQIMGLLKELAVARNIAIVSTIHQPSTQVFDGFDKVMLLTMGRTAYFGPAAAALPHFAALGRVPDGMVNPADYLLEITNGDFSEKADVIALLNEWPASEEGRNLSAMMQLPSPRSHATAKARLSFMGKDKRGAASAAAASKSADGRAVAGAGARKTVAQRVLAVRDRAKAARRGTKASLGQLVTLMWRITLNYKRDPAAYLFRCILFAFMSFFLGSVYYKVGNERSDIYNRVFLILWMNCFNAYMDMAALPCFSLEKEAVTKELVNGQYNVGIFCLANATVQLVFVLATNVLAVVPAYWITDMNADANRFFQFYIIMFGLLYTMESVAVLIGSLIKNFILGLSVYATFVSMNFIFNGQFITVDVMPEYWKWMYYISPLRYSWEALAKIVFEGQTYAGPCTVCYGSTGEEVLDTLTTGGKNLNDVNIGAWLGVLFLWSFGARIAHYYVMRRIM